MGAPRFDPSTGLPFGVRVDGPGEAERKKVAVCRAHLKAMQGVWERRKSVADEMRRMLAGRHFGAQGGSTGVAIEGGKGPSGTQEEDTNLFLRAQRLLKSEAADEAWGTRYPAMGDLPDEMIDEMESFCDRLAIAANAAREFSDALDDGGTVGPMVVHLSCHKVVSRKKQAGAVTPIADLVQAAANGADVHPIPGMDYLALADACRGFLADPEQQMLRTIEEQDNLIRLAQEADQAWADEAESAPSGETTYGDLACRRLVYGDDVWWDSRITTRWQDARKVAIRKLFTPEECRTIEEWKPSARNKLNGAVLDTRDGYPSLVSADLTRDENDALNRWVSVIEFWDRDEGTVHYFVENGEYQGFLERDSRYPYLDARGKPILKDWFPIRACTPVVHNERTPDRTLGIPWLYPAKAAAIRYNLFAKAESAARRKAGRVVTCRKGMAEDTRAQLEGADDLAIIEEPDGIKEGEEFFKIHTWGEAPADFGRGKQEALLEFARDVDISVEKMTGQSVEPTVGQAQMAQSGSDASRGGLLRKLQTFAGEIVADLARLAAAFWTDEKVTQLMGPEFARKSPAMQPGIDPATGQQTMVPMTNPDGSPALLPSMWELFKGSSTLGDQIQVVFSPSSQDLMRQKAEDDTLALLASPAGMNPLTGLPYFDPRPLLERAIKTRGMGRVQPFPEPPPMPPGEDGDGEDGDEPPGGGKDREAEGGGRTDGRAAHGMRGPPPVPGRQGRGEGRKPGDHGDQSVRAHRVSTQ